MRSRRTALIVLAAAIGAGAVAGGVVAVASGAGGGWRIGDDTASIGQTSPTGALQLKAKTDINFLAGHVRLMSEGSDFDFEVPKGMPAMFNAYYIGTPTRTPIQLGDEGQGVTPLVVTGSAHQSADLQRWTIGSNAVAAIDAKGRLRLGDVTLSTAVVKGAVVLYGTDPSGKRVVIARGTAKH